LAIGSFGLIQFQSFAKERVTLFEAFKGVIKETELLDFASLKMHAHNSLKTPFLILERKNEPGWNYIISRRYEFRHFPSPHSPTELKAVVVILKNERSVRTYLPSGSDSQWIFDCWQIDWDYRAVISHAEFKGSIPRDRSGSLAGSGSTHYGSEPWAEIAQWLSTSISH
jgi:hypothetical protein